MGTVGTRPELGVELGAYHPGVISQLADLDQGIVGEGAAGHQASFLKLGAELVVQLVAVTVALNDFVPAVGGARFGLLHQATGVAAEAHGAALFLHPLLLRQQAYDGVGALRVELCGVGIVGAEQVTGELHYHHLKPQAEPQIRHVVLAGVAGGPDLPLEAALPEAAGDDDAVHPRQHLLHIRILHVLGVQPVYVDAGPVLHAGVDQRFLHREVGVRQLHVFAYDRDLHLTAGAL